MFAISLLTYKRICKTLPFYTQHTHTEIHKHIHLHNGFLTPSLPAVAHSFLHTAFHVDNKVKSCKLLKLCGERNFPIANLHAILYFQAIVQQQTTRMRNHSQWVCCCSQSVLNAYNNTLSIYEQYKRTHRHTATARGHLSNSVL